MAIPSKLRLILLCAISLLRSGHALSDDPAQIGSWFDRQLEKKSQALLSLNHKPDERSTLLAVALLDEIYDLREQVSNPAAVDNALAAQASDAANTALLRAEANYLLHLVKDRNAEGSNQKAVDALLNWASAKTRNDAEVLDATAAVGLSHGNPVPQLEQAASASNSPESWYRAARGAVDDYHRTRALRRTLELDHNYVPAVLDLARQYAAQSQITRARTLLLVTLEHLPAEDSIHALLAGLDINQGRASSALNILNQLRSRPLPIAVTRELASNYAQLGFLREARELADLSLKLNPGGLKERDLVYRLAEQATDNGVAEPRNLPEQANGSSHSRADDKGGQIKESDAESTRLRRLLNGQPISIDDDSPRFFANVPETILKWRSRPAGERKESRILAEVRVDRLRADYQAVKHIQQLIAVTSNADVGTYRLRAIQYSPQSEQLSILRARVHHPDGRTAEAEDQGDASLGDASIATYYDLRARQYRFRDLHAGDVIELEYTLTPVTPRNRYGNYFAELIAFGAAVPCDLQRYVLRSPREIHLSSSEHLLPRPTLRHKASEDVFVWERGQIPALVREPRSPAWSEQGAYVHVSNFASWQALGKWYAELIRPQFALNPELESLVTDVIARHPNRLDRVAAIDQLVLKSTRYVALEFGVYGFKPYAVTQTFARRFGDCKDKASLMVALLGAADIDADIALVRTQRLGDIAGQPASASIFDHAIVYVPEFDLWLDGTAEFSRLRELPVEDQGVMALTIDKDGNAIMRRTPASSASDNYSRRTINAWVQSDGTIRFSGASYVRGEDAPELRRQLEPADSKLGYVRDRLAQVLPAVELHDVELPLSVADAVSLSFNGELSSFQGHHSATLPSSWMERNYVASLAPKVTRHQDLLLGAPWTTTEEIHIHLPEGAHLVGLPKDQSFFGEFGHATIEYHVDGLEITVLSTVQFTATRINVARYSEFRDFAAGLDDAFHRDLEVELR